MRMSQEKMREEAGAGGDVGKGVVDRVARLLGVKVVEPLVRRQPSTTTCRAVALLVIGAIFVLFEQQCTFAVANAWSWLRTAWWFQHDSFEPVLATVSFFPWLALFYILDMHTPSAKAFRIQQHRNDMSNWTNTGKGSFSGWPILLGYLLPLLVFDQLYPRRRLPLQAPTAPRLVGEVVGLLIVYDALFFFCHRTMHMHKPLYRRFHALHHAKPGPVRHDAHHLDGRHYFQKFFTYLDNAFGPISDKERRCNNTRQK
ncbi:hypothetical protein PTSG_05190 [Salpingoeca rosetta]|uniref:Fatty acid hydroxylase domain-containing protein n=1 Tax=Salpingoeca rosetta (strain ATCC 50818 / BSB-021) TaxID=946362 RepID=F2UAS0_SALR5|nr:uncharacterized protein PTSG_05190 [Salpingoeca rosetta]EGD73486.1 hypothetical protein PTSG_05190 [Salpingoeca rosetta]|eukprot:XP_004993768.1 hypothetical protein PTSG_05190 [Salpingoeca rosetta]